MVEVCHHLSAGGRCQKKSSDVVVEAHQRAQVSLRVVNQTLHEVWYMYTVPDHLPHPGLHVICMHAEVLFVRLGLQYEVLAEIPAC